VVVDVVVVVGSPPGLPMRRVVVEDVVVEDVVVVVVELCPLQRPGARLRGRALAGFDPERAARAAARYSSAVRFWIASA
jgi:hypothetical protein